MYCAEGMMESAEGVLDLFDAARFQKPIDSIVDYWWNCRDNEEMKAFKRHYKSLEAAEEAAAQASHSVAALPASMNPGCGVCAFGLHTAFCISSDLQYCNTAH
jgi:hypothetical protein